MDTEQAQRLGMTEWLEAVEELYERIRAWASEMTPVPEFEYEPITLNEKWSGYYQIPQLIIRQGEDSMEVTPKARAVLGSDGLVQLWGLDGPFNLMLQETEPSTDSPGANGSLTSPRKKVREWYWHEDREPWRETKVDGPLFRELAESCLR